MKAAILSLSCAALLNVAAANPHHQKPQHEHLHHDKRAVETVSAVVTNNVYVTYDAQKVVVYVDEDGKPLSTSTVFDGPARTVSSSTSSHTPPPPPPTTSSSSSSTAPPPPPPTTPSSSTPAQSPASIKKEAKFAVQDSPSPPPPVSSSAPPAVPSSSSAPSPPPSSSTSPSSSGPGFSNGISYSPYNADNTCKNTQQVASDIAMINGYSLIRLYGTDCNQVANVLAAVKGKNIQLFLGIFNIDNINGEVGTMSSALGGNWGIVNTVSVGNELVNTGAKSVADVVRAIGDARTALKTAGYSGPVVTVDTMVAMKANPDLCKASDFCAINCHAFFDPNTEAEGAGAFVAKWVSDISAAANGKTTVVTESGWPSQGGSNGKAVAGQQQQQAALSSLKGSFSTNLIHYTAFNDLWKKDSGSTFGAEKFWGIYGNSPS